MRVSRSNSLGDPPKGIPFYAKTGVCRQQTDWLEPQYILTYESKSGTTATGPVDKVLSRQQFSQKTVQDFIANPGAPSAWKTAIFDLPGPDSINESNSADITREEAAGNWVRVSNSGAVEAVVDYGNVFYLNSARPLAGTTQVDAKLAADGTLTEGSVQVEDQTIAAISSLISSASTAAAGFAAPHITTTEPAQPENKLSVKTKVYKHSHSQYLDLKTPATPFTCVASPSGVAGGSFTVTEVADSSKSKADGDKDNTISVSGSIVLPKAAPSSSPLPPSGTTPTPKKP
ncbi:MAG: hypothetical protein WCD43_16840 [Candidatus Acidiferrales bacterium]